MAKVQKDSSKDKESKPKGEGQVKKSLAVKGADADVDAILAIIEVGGAYEIARWPSVVGAVLKTRRHSSPTPPSRFWPGRDAGTRMWTLNVA